MRMNASDIVHWHVNAACAVHPDMKSHTEDMMTVSKKAMTSPFIKQKVNSKSFTEAELIKVNDTIVKVLWAMKFSHCQGFSACECIVHQNDKSVILLKTNERSSAEKRLKHLNVKYFYIEDQVNQEKTQVKCCSTDEMKEDCQTKPKQESAFNHVRAETLSFQSMIVVIVDVMWFILK